MHVLRVSPHDLYCLYVESFLDYYQSVDTYLGSNCIQHW
jgi:hypothetical protein